MTSLINPSNINGNFPIAGQDNDSQGFRDNFTNIKNNFTFAQSDINDLQSKVVLKQALIGGSLNNNFLGSQLQNAQLWNYSETVYDWGSTSGAIQLDFALGNIHKVISSGSIQINSVIKNWPGSLQFSRMLFYINISNTSYNLSLPNTVTTDLGSVPGLRFVGGSNTINFLNTGNYIFEFSSADSGSTVFVRELTHGNQSFIDPNFFLANIGAGLNSGVENSGYQVPTLYLGYGNLLSIGQTIDSVKSGADVLSIHGPMTSFYRISGATNDKVTEGSNTNSLMNQAGFTVARSRQIDSGFNVVPTGFPYILNTGDLVGYFNSLGYIYNQASTLTYSQLSSIQMYANGVNTLTGIGGNIILATKQDGIDGLMPAVVIDNTQSVTIMGNLDVKGRTTYLESQALIINDKQIFIANNSANSEQSNGAGLEIVLGGGTYANLTYVSPVASGLTTGTFNFNLPVNISAGTSSVSTTSGALIVNGGIGVAGNINLGGNLGVGGSFSLTSSTNATSPATGAFVLANGGLGVALNMVAGGIISANSTIDSNSTSSGSLITQGGLGVALTSRFGGNVIILSTSPTIGSGTGALIVQGGTYLNGNLIANVGNVLLGNTNNSIFPNNNQGYSAPLILLGGAHIVKTLNLGNNIDQSTTRLQVNAPVGSSGTGMDPAPDGGISGNPPSYTGAAVLIGNSSATAGMVITGTINHGTTTTGTVIVRNRSNTYGTTVQGTPTPYTPTLLNSSPIYGALWIGGGATVLWDLYVGQPSQNNTLTSVTGGAGNIIIQSGTQATNNGTGALQIQKVQLAGGGYSAGGMSVQGNVYATGNLVLGGDGAYTLAGKANSNVTIDSTTFASNVYSGALVVRGGIAVGGGILGTATQNAPSYFAGNIVINSSIAGTSGGISGVTFQAPTGGLVITGTGGISVNGASIIGGNLVLASATTSSGYTSGALVVTGGVGIGGAINMQGGISSGGQLVLSVGTVATSNSTGALVISGGGGAGISGNTFVGPTNGTASNPNPINAVGVAGVSIVSVSGVAFTTTSLTATPITGLNFTAQPGGTYEFEGALYVSVSGAVTVSVQINYSGGSSTYTVEPQTTTTGTFSPTTASASASSVSAVYAGAVGPVVTRFRGAYYNSTAGAVNVNLTILNSINTVTTTVAGYSYIKWTRLT
jgi:hypothetical protein